MAHQVKDATIRLRALDGVWETAGTDRSRGIYAENLEQDWDPWGPKTASFDLRRSPRTPWPDIAAFTDVEIEVAGVQNWKGRVLATPTRDTADRAMSVQCEGMQAHLDDDVLVPAYVHTSLADFKDMRTSPSAALGAGANQLPSAAQVTTDGGAIVLTFPNDMNVAAFNVVGVQLDLGSQARAKSVVVDWSAFGTDAGTTLYVKGSDTPDLTGSSEVLSATTLAAGPNVSYGGTLTTARRYVQVFLYRSGAALTPNTQDVWVRLTGIRLDTGTYLAGGVSVLKATDVFRDAINRGTSLLDPDRSLIATTAFQIPDFFSLEQRSTREVIDAANAYHGYITKIDERARPVFQPLPAAPMIEVGEFTALEVEDASNNSGTDIYNRCVVTGQTAAGERIVVERSAGQQAGAQLLPVSSPAADNPSFDVNAASWASTGPGTHSIARTTTAGEFDSGPAGGKWDLTAIGGSGGQHLKETFTGTFKAGVTYYLTFSAKASSAYAAITAGFGDAAALVLPVPLSLTTSFQGFSLAWTPTVDSAAAVFDLFNGSKPAPVVYVDTLTLYRAAPTLVDRRGFRRTKVLQVSSALDNAGLVGTQLADTYLSNHRTAQFKGTATIVGSTAREILTGKTIPPEQLGMRTCELLRFNDRVDPDSGAVGRDGRIATVKYTLADDKATLTIDNTSQNFEALLARLAVIQGAGQ